MSAHVGQAIVLLTQSAEKFAAAPEISYGMKGKLVKSKSGWILLTVPNSLVRSAFSALNEQGIELPSQSNGSLNAHISVMRPEELKTIEGGADAVTERGKEFAYTLGPIRTVTPEGWGEMSKVWFIEVKSPELQNLRKSYGLTALPKNDRFKFHITIAVRKKNALRKTASLIYNFERPSEPPTVAWMLGDPTYELEKRADGAVPTVAVDLDGTILTYDGWKGEDHFGELRSGAKKALKYFQKMGWRIIIFTTRGATQKVKDKLHELDVPYDYVNENPDQPEGSSDKIIADVYIDDRAIDARKSWAEITQLTEKRMKAAGAQFTSPLDKLTTAKQESDRGNYPAKHSITRDLMTTSPDDFIIDSTIGNVVGITHVPTGFKFHLPRRVLPPGYSQQQEAV